MAAAGRRQRGRRTHTVPEEVDLARIPRSFVIKNGKVSKAVQNLSRDIRQAYRPWTAINLKEKRQAKLKDYSDVGGVLNISHMVILRQRHERVYASFLRTKGGEGPSCHFRVLNYSLIRDVFKCQHHPRSSDSDYQMSPLIVTQGFDKKPSDTNDVIDCEILAEIKKKIFLDAFPTHSPEESQQGTSSLRRVKRVILFVYSGDKLFEMRHFAIVKTAAFRDQFDLNPKVKRSPYKNELKEEAASVKKEELDDDEKIDFLRKNVSLVELGPRITMKLCDFQRKLTPNLRASLEEEVTEKVHDGVSKADDSVSDSEDDSENEYDSDSVPFDH